ncbi:hypothetical protein COU74_04310 [Candidatus Peregrinibacteria bacterium CG10_big_fil_rev_8_21_14_0_10_36_19]|nr:MAG: hypothetical protein COU74_04310 [Candidatus Peregrinibacteria bacterium CG10_big_fil_rev_8_21_14_0_10_36_19]
MIFVLLFNLWKTVFKSEPTQGAYMHIVGGTVEMKTWGTEDFFELASDALIVQGDELKTSAGAQVIVEFFDGTVMRLDGGSDVVFEEMSDDPKAPAMSLLLVDGKAWFNKVYKNSESTNIVVRGSDIVVASSGSNIFEVVNEFDESVRVLHGDSLSVDVISNDDSGKVVDTETIGVGQEIVFNDDVLARYWQHQSPSVLSALSDEFKDSSWYLWNTDEDKNPTEFVKVDSDTGTFIKVEPKKLEPPIEEEALDGESSEDSEGESVDGAEKDSETKDGDSATEKEDPKKAESAPLKKPTIASVEGLTKTNSDGFYVVTGRLATLTGTVSGAEKVIVNGFTLTKFKPGDTTWSYFANADFSLMVKGENTYEIVAVSADGTKSEPLIVKVFHDPAAAVEPATNSEGLAD